MASAPSTDRGRSSRARIVDTACALFYRRGVAATGLNEIAAASRTGKSQLYHYFRDKPDLVLAVVAEQVERTLQPQQASLQQLADAGDLRVWADQAVAAHQQGEPARCPLGALVSELADHDDELRAALDTGFDRWRSALAAGLAQLQQHGHVRPGHSPGDLAEILLCAYEGGVLLSEVRGTTRPLRLALDAALDWILTGPDPAKLEPCDPGSIRPSRSTGSLRTENFPVGVAAAAGSVVPMDEDLEAMSRERLLVEARRLRAGVRAHRDSSGHDLCWHHPDLWGLLPEQMSPSVAAPPWPQFIRGCVAYRTSLDDELAGVETHEREYDE